MSRLYSHLLGYDADDENGTRVMSAEEQRAEFERLKKVIDRSAETAASILNGTWRPQPPRIHVYD